jgi:uncharacterized membrane-anchored protein
MTMMMALIFVALMLILGETFIDIRSARLKLGQIEGVRVVQIRVRLRINRERFRPLLLMSIMMMMLLLLFNSNTKRTRKRFLALCARERACSIRALGRSRRHLPLWLLVLFSSMTTIVLFRNRF